MEYRVERGPVTVTLTAPQEVFAEFAERIDAKIDWASTGCQEEFEILYDAFEAAGRVTR